MDKSFEGDHSPPPAMAAAVLQALHHVPGATLQSFYSLACLFHKLLGPRDPFASASRVARTIGTRHALLISLINSVRWVLFPFYR